MQSALSPAGPAAQDVTTLVWILTIGASLILLLVTALAADGTRRAPAPVRSASWVVGGGIVLPLVVLSALFLYSARFDGALGATPRPGSMRIEVEGRQWWWEVRYPRPTGPALVDANEIHVPVGAEIEFVVTSPDVIHSFWVPALGGKVDMTPGHTGRIGLRADRVGVYRGQCAEYCGVQHAHMALLVVAEPPEAFAAWLSAQAAPAGTPATEAAARGLEAFMAEGCGGCHTIRGTPASGLLGPDLTHLASRRTVAAGTLANDARAIRAFVAAGHVIKPGMRMPSYAHLQTPTLDDLAAYLASLR
jgi:cytochrome c oxidase subunit II